MLKLGVNVDHVATLRQARYRLDPESVNSEPSVLEAALICENAGADSLTVHLRADRRHIQDRDVWGLRKKCGLRLNLEMGNTPEILAIALSLKPDDVCLVPENRQEVTTEGGLDVFATLEELQPTVSELQENGIRVSLFIDPEPRQIEASKMVGADMVELHTGAFANASGEEQITELARLAAAAGLAFDADLQVNAGHGINYSNVLQIRGITQITELNIGHAIVSRALFVGLATAVTEMLRAMNSHA